MSDQTLAFRMQLKPGYEAEYQRRHEALWPELADALTEAGIYDYWIFLDQQTLSLFAVLKLRPDNQRDALPLQPVMRRWWDYMAELMVVQDDNRPVEWPLKPVFHFPG
jgi:L-rhamnose mutarotase